MEALDLALAFACEIQQEDSLYRTIDRGGVAADEWSGFWMFAKARQRGIKHDEIMEAWQAYRAS